jgi:succinylarginine dihydrolase
LVSQTWPEQIDAPDLGQPELIREIEGARTALLDLLDLTELL